jgi:hypothetical protein
MYSSFLERTSAVQTILPVITISNATVTGVAVDRTGYLSCGVEYTAGVCPSLPTGFTVALVVRDCLTSNGTFADYATIPTFGTAGGLSAASTVKYQNVDLRGAKRWILVSETLTFTGGSSPSQIGGVNFIFGDASNEPPVQTGTNTGVLPTQ